jgi:endo-beta-N-acetylglucosaminidase D
MNGITMENENPKIEWCQKLGISYLKFTFKGKLKESDALKAIKKWKEAFNTKSGEKIVLVWDCLEMENYDTNSRIEWQNALKEMKNQIDSIWLITNSVLIKVGARVMSLFTSLEIKIVSSENEINIGS